jgi:outer membrane scaffolding protein for murein synthesis (MipA/OmpV family)
MPTHQISVDPQVAPMKNLFLSYSPVFGAMVAWCLCQGVACAQSDSAGLPQWELGVIAGALSSPAYPASAERFTRQLVLPYLIYRGERLQVGREGINAHLRLAPGYELDVGVSGSFPASSQDIAARQGMPDLGTLLEFGPRLKVDLGRPWPGFRWGLELPLRNVVEFNGGARSPGWVFEPALALEGANIGAGWSLNAKAGFTWGDQQVNQFLYGVPADYATASRPSFEARSGLISARASLGTSKSLTPDVRFFGYARMDYYGLGANTDSPLALQNSSPSLGVGLTWTLGRSRTLVAW